MQIVVVAGPVTVPWSAESTSEQKTNEQLVATTPVPPVALSPAGVSTRSAAIAFAAGMLLVVVLLALAYKDHDNESVEVLEFSECPMHFAPRA